MCYRSNIPQEDMSPPLGHIIPTPNQPVVTTYKYDARLAEKQRLPILKSSVWLGQVCLKRCSVCYSPTSPMNCCRSYFVFMKPVIGVHQYCTTPVSWHGCKPSLTRPFRIATYKDCGIRGKPKTHALRFGGSKRETHVPLTPPPPPPPSNK